MNHKHLFLIVWCLIITGCLGHQIRDLKPVDDSIKSMTVPAGGFLAGAVKDCLKKNGWDVFIDRGPVTIKQDGLDKIKFIAESTFKTRYRMQLSYRQFDYCLNGDPAYVFDMAVINNDSGEEAITLSGRNCESYIIEDFERWLTKAPARQQTY